MELIVEVKNAKQADQLEKVIIDLSKQSNLKGILVSNRKADVGGFQKKRQSAVDKAVHKYGITNLKEHIDGDFASPIEVSGVTEENRRLALDKADLINKAYQERHQKKRQKTQKNPKERGIAITKEDLIKKHPKYKSVISDLFNAFESHDETDFENSVKGLFESLDKKIYKLGVKGNVSAADEFARQMHKPMKEAIEKASTYDERAHYFNTVLNLRTRRGKIFSGTAILRLERKLKELGLDLD
ncbi:MAG: hypothetical protein AAGA64_02190 [Bacteroidota bacterium]